MQAKDLGCDSNGRLVGPCVFKKLNDHVDGVKFQSCGCCGYGRGGAASYGYGDAKANAKAMNEGTAYNGPTIGYSDPTVSVLCIIDTLLVHLCFRRSVSSHYFTTFQSADWALGNHLGTHQLNN